jgi:hypothetical protein
MRRIGSPEKRDRITGEKQEGGGSGSGILIDLLVLSLLYLYSTVGIPFFSQKGLKMRLFSLKICGLNYFGDRIVSRETSRFAKKGKKSRQKVSVSKANLHRKAVLQDA